MDVYIAGIMVCPLNRQEQDSDYCLFCDYFLNHI